MKELDVLELFIKEIEAVVDVPVRMSNHDEDHQADMVLIDSLDTNTERRSTTPYIIQEDDGKRLQFYHKARLDLTTQSEDEVKAYELRQKIKDRFRPYEEHPKKLDKEVVQFQVGDGGERETEFEPTVFRLFKQTQTFNFDFTDDMVVDADVLEEIEDNLDN